MARLKKSAITDFLAKPREDVRPWKRYKRAKLNALMRQLPVRPPIWKKLRKHQRVCLLLGAQQKSWAYFLDTGCGKTLLSIALMRYFRRATKAKKFLVLVPNSINMYEWGDEIQKHSPNTKFTILDGSSEDKWREVKTNDSLIYVTTYMGLMHMVCYDVKNPKTKKMEMKISPPAMSWMLENMSGVILDESTAAGNHMSLTHRICRRLCNKLPHKFILTGTPFGKDPTPLWAQMKLIDGGESLGPTVELFRAAFFKEAPNPFSGFPEYTYEKKNDPLLHRFIAHRSIEYEADAADLPKMIPLVKEVKMSSDAAAHYGSLREQFFEAVKGRHGIRDTQVIRNHFLRMRQISSGFIGYKDDEDGSKAELEFDDNPKLDSTMSLLVEIVPSYKAVVFVEFVFSGSMLCRELQAAGIGHTRIYGKTKDSKEVLRRFKDDEDCRVLVLNNSCGGFGLNLQVAKYGIYYESPLSPILRKQTRRRVERQGSEHKKVFIYDMVTKGSDDRKILKALEEGRNLLESIMRGERARLRVRL